MHMPGLMPVRDMPNEETRYVAFENIARKGEQIYIDPDAITVAQRDMQHSIAVVRHGATILVIMSDELFAAVTSQPSGNFQQATRRPI